jgi:GAF domain-containing protein/CheY-like chemotaxis protein
MHDADDRRLVRIFEDITSRLLASAEYNRLYSVAVQIAMETTDAQACSLYLEQNLADPERDPSRIVMVAGAGFERHRIGVSYKKGEGLTGGIWQKSKAIRLDSQAAIENRKKGWRGLHNALVQGQEPQWRSYSLIGVPLRIGKRTIGVLKVENKKPGEPACFSKDDETLLETIASTIAMAIENQRSFERANGEILEALGDMTGMLVGPEVMSMETMCDRIVEKCIDIFKAEACSLYMQGENRADSIVMVSGAGYEKLRQGARYKRGEGLTGTIWGKGQAVKYDTQKEIENPANGWKGLNNTQIQSQRANWKCCSLIGVPLKIGTRSIGVLKVENKKPVEISHFTHNELRTLEIVASNIGLALEMRRQEGAIFTKGEMARVFAHDVASQLGNAEDALHLAHAAAKEGDAFHVVAERIEIASNAVKGMKELHRRLLEKSQSETSRQTVSINELLRQIKERARALQTGGITLAVSELPHVAYTQISTEEVLRAFDKLLENSMDALRDKDASKPRRVWIEARLDGGTPDNPQRAVILFVDNGPGLTPDQIADFQESWSIKSTKHLGSGRGLGVAHRCLADSGIKLRIVDPPSTMTTCGAAFEITVTLHVPRLLRVLVVDDHDTLLDLVRSGVRADETIELETRSSYDLILNACREVPEALDELARYHLILLDCNFTGQPFDGPDLLESMRRAIPEQATRVVLMSREAEYLGRPDVEVLNKSEDLVRRLPHVLHELREPGRTER